jgi:hypothetical protein
LSFAERVRKTSGQTEISDTQKREDAGNRDPRAVALAAQISDRERDRDDTDENRQNAAGEGRGSSLKETTRAALAMISGRTTAQSKTGPAA